MSCEKELTYLNYYEGGASLIGTNALPQEICEKINGIYEINYGQDFGKKLVIKFSGRYLSVFSGKNAGYMVLGSGYKDSVIYFEGYWRFAEGSETGPASFSIAADDGGRQLLSGSTPLTIVIRGNYLKDGEGANREIIIQRERDLRQNTKNFYIIGHRGGGRNFDRLPASENSIGLLKYAERLGCNAVEIDVQTTSDHVPVLFHDEYLSKRLINEDFFTGKVSDYSFAMLRSFCSLTNGERIPSLEEALQTIVDSTELKLVWLDVKGKDMIPQIVSIQQKFLELASSKGRVLEILIGLADEDTFNDFIGYNDYKLSPSLCELDENFVNNANAVVWAPRWSLGLLDERVAAMHNEGKRIFVWTLDLTELIRSYVRRANFDGIVTNFPGKVTYENYIAD